MNRQAAFFFAIVALALFGASVGQAQTPPPATRPAVVTNYNAFRVTLGVPTTSPYIAVPTTGSPVCVAAMNLPFSNTYFTPQGSDDSYVWRPLTGIGNGSIITPGVYVGTNPYRFFRLYFTQSSSPGASGYEACGDNATSLLAPMLNGIDGVLNTYQELIAIGHAGCASFDSNGFLLPTGSSCSGGGGSFTCDAPHSCVTFQTSPSPSPEATDAGGNSAAVAGILQGGHLYTVSGDVFGIASSMSLCPNAQTITCGDFVLSNSSGNTIDLSQLGNYSQLGSSLSMSDSSSLNIQGTGSATLNLQTNTGEISIQTNNELSESSGSAGMFFSSTGAGFISAATELSLSASNASGSSNGIALGGKIIQGSNPSWGTCTMSAATTCDVVLAVQYTTFQCSANQMGNTPDTFASCALNGACVAGVCSYRVTAHDSNSDKWSVIILGSPN